MPRPSFEATADQRKTVRAMVAYGIPLEDIAEVIGVTRKTLSKHFKREIRTSKPEANAQVAQNLFSIATKKGGGSPTVTAAIFWLKTRAGFKEPTVIEGNLRTSGVHVYVPNNRRGEG